MRAVVQGLQLAIQSCVVAGLCFVTIPIAWASAPKETIVCTHAAKSFWLGEKKIRKVFGEENFVQVFFKISKGNCYEFYAIGKDGSAVEAYYEPVTGERIRYNRIAANGQYSTNTHAKIIPELTSTIGAASSSRAVSKK
jgi:hypothetical protein